MASQFLRVGTLTVICLAFSIAPLAMGQGTPAGQPAAAPAGNEKPALSPQELEQLLAPLALYPDSLLAQMFMAATYPLEVVEAERWMKANADLKGDALTAALEKQTWDASIKSLVNFPDVLAMMSEKLDLTVKLGDAFLGQQQQVMDTVQKLRAKANAQGNLESNQQQVVTVEPAAAGAQTQTIIIEAGDPQVVYVPQYNPTVVYGTWPYPAYPPYPYHPPGYVASNLVSFGVGVAVGAAWGYAWGNCNWGRHDVDIDINRNTNINNNIDRSRYRNEYQRNTGTSQAGKGAWKHDSTHRRGLPYRDAGSAQQFGGRSAAQAAQSRDAYRGHAEAGRQNIARGGADQFRGAGADRPTSAGRLSPAPGGGSNTGRRDHAFSGSSRSGSATRAASSRGSASRSRSGASHSRGGASRSRGGASRSRGGGRRR